MADSTLDLMCTFPPNHLAPAAVTRAFARSLMDPPLRSALGYPAPPRPVQVLSRLALRAHGRVVRFLPVRTESSRFRDMPSVRSYPDGYDVEALGTFPRGTFPKGCPVPPSRGRSVTGPGDHTD